jgi:hypothetical protein
MFYVYHAIKQQGVEAPLERSSPQLGSGAHQWGVSSVAMTAGLAVLRG